MLLAEAERSVNLTQRGKVLLRVQDKVKVEGRITQVLAGTMFRAKSKDGREVLVAVRGKMRKRLTIGDKVTVELPPSGPDEGQQPVAISPEPKLPPDSIAHSG
jgi:translation initiation factor IF-1